jgi:hypothetical protein
MRFFATAFAAIVAAAAIPSVALADVSYTFNVPVTLSNLTPSQVAYVDCNLYSGTNGGGTLLGGGEGAPIPVTANGSYSGTYTVVESSPTLPASYRCWIIVTAKGSSTTLNIINGRPDAPQPGWTGTMLTSGNF